MNILPECAEAIKAVHRAGGVAIEVGELQDVRELLRGRGRRIDRPRRRFEKPIDDFEPVGTILRRMRLLHEAGITSMFDAELSLTLDRLVQAEEGA